MGRANAITRRRLAWVLLVGAALACYLVVLPAVNPLRRSTEAITADLLRQTPPGTPRESVQDLAAERGWGRGGVVGAGREGDLPVVLGTYQGVPFLVRVFALWEFDDQGRLVTVRVRKWAADAP